MPRDDALCGKENICPGAQTNCNSLVRNLKSGGKEVSPEQQRQDFESQVSRGSSLDPVQVWSNYAKWAMDRRSLNVDAEAEASAVLKRACMSLAVDPRFNDDPRYLRLWVHYANLLPEPHQVFHNLNEQGIGVGHALLYEAWASSLEQKHRFEETEEAYQLGFLRGAQPLERLRSRHADFQKRQRRRAARRSGSHGSSQVTPSPAGSATVPVSASPAVVLQQPSRREPSSTEPYVQQLSVKQQRIEQPTSEQPPLARMDQPLAEQLYIESALADHPRTDQPPADQLPPVQGNESHVLNDMPGEQQHDVSSNCRQEGMTLPPTETPDGELLAEDKAIPAMIVSSAAVSDMTLRGSSCEAEPLAAATHGTLLGAPASEEEMSSAGCVEPDQDVLQELPTQAPGVSGKASEVKRRRSRSIRRHEDVSVEEMRAEYMLKAIAASEVQAPEEPKAASVEPSPRLQLKEATTLTQELTTNGVRALLRSYSRESRCSSISRPSVSSSAFEDATFTTEFAKREVLSILAHDPHNDRPAAPEIEGRSDALAAASSTGGQAMPTEDKEEQPHAPGLLNVFEEELPSAPSLFNVFEEEPPLVQAGQHDNPSRLKVFEDKPPPEPAAAGGTFEVFEETSFDLSVTGPSQAWTDADGSAGPGLRRRSSGELRWDDSEFDAMMG